MEKQTQLAPRNTEVSKPKKATEAAQPNLVTKIPSFDIIEHGDSLELKFDMPAVKTEGLDVTFSDGVLTVEGTAQPAQFEGLEQTHREFFVNRFFAQLRLPSSVDGSAVNAKLNRGVLTVTAPKNERTSKRRIEVTAA